MEMPAFLQKIIDKSPVLERVADIISIYFDRRLGRAAAAFAYYLMLSFFPLLICVSSILGKANLDTGVIVQSLDGIVPMQVIDTLTGFLQYVSENYSITMLVASVLLLVTTASGAFSTLMTSMGDLYGRKRYSGFLHTIMSVLYSFLFVIMIYGSVLLLITGGWFIRLLDEWFHIGAIIKDWQWLRFVLLVAIIILLLSLLYRLVSPRQKPPLPILPGAATAAVLILIVSIVFSIMISASAKYALVYGSLASLIILMLWLHLIGALILAGGIINLTARDAAKKRAHQTAIIKRQAKKP